MAFNGKVLLVDDEPHIRKFISVLIKQLGDTTVIEAGNGQDAIATYQSESPDLVLLDVNMPVLDGLSTLRSLMQIDPDAVVIMLTSLTSRQMIEQAVELGASNYIRKDTKPEEILQALKETVSACFDDESP